MDLLQTVVLALVQGLSEFLPISSSAHLILPSQVLGWADQGLAFDVAVHVGSLIAVIIYFRHELREMLSAVAAQLTRQPLTPTAASEATLAWQVVVGTIPAVVVALFTKELIEAHLRSMEVIAATTIVFGLLLGVAELRSRRQHSVISMSFKLAMLIGLAQVLALIPGTSRSGITMTAAVLLGLSRTDGARFSFLLSIPVILIAGLSATLDLADSDQAVDWPMLALAVLVSGISAWSCIALFLRLIERIGFMPFVIYRLLLGISLTAISLGYL